jgi:hypothetical protein
MAACNVVAVVHDRGNFAKIGNMEACKIVVSVSDANGKGVGGLAQANFKVSKPGANFTVAFAGPDPSGFAGFYVIDIKPGFQWKKAQYHFCIQVVSGKRPALHGQTVTLLQMY